MKICATFESFEDQQQSALASIKYLYEVFDRDVLVFEQTGGGHEGTVCLYHCILATTKELRRSTRRIEQTKKKDEAWVSCGRPREGGTRRHRTDPRHDHCTQTTATHPLHYRRSHGHQIYTRQQGAITTLPCITPPLSPRPPISFTKTPSTCAK